MKNQGGTSIVLDGVAYEVVFSEDLTDSQRSERGLPPRGTRCGCDRCECQNEADIGTVEDPICGCCLADCPDVHPDAEINAN